MEYKFPAYRKSPGVVIGFVILFACIAPFVFSEEIHWELLVPGLFILFFAYVLIASTFKLFITYYINRDSIRIYKPPFHHVTVPFDRIQQVMLVSEEESKALMEKLMMEQNRFAENADLPGYISYIRKNSPVYKYFTFAPTAKVTTVGANELVTSVDVKSRTRFIVVSLTNEKVLFLSPKDPVGFKKTYDAMMLPPSP